MDWRTFFSSLITRSRRFSLVSLLCGSAWGIVVISQIWIFLALHEVRPPLVLRYANGTITQFGGVWELQGYAFVMWVIVVMNYLLALELEERDWFWGKFVASMTFFLSTLLFMAFQAIIVVN